MLPEDASQVKHLYRRLLAAKPHEVPVIRDALFPHKDQLLDKLWSLEEVPDVGEVVRMVRIRDGESG